MTTQKHKSLSELQHLTTSLRVETPYHALDLHFARFISEQEHALSPQFTGEKLKALYWGALLASQQTQEQNACVDLAAFSGRKVSEDSELTFPKIKDWMAALKEAQTVGHEGELKPLILDGTAKLYLYRYWDYEQRLAQNIRRRLAQPAEYDPQILRSWGPKLFSDYGIQNDQLRAAFSAVMNRFTVITGGPGTGKTTTLTRVISLLLLHHPEMKIALAAPTGKAAARMKESIQQQKESLALPESLLNKIPHTASTLHRLLGYISDSVSFRHHADNPIPADVVVVDEASMIDLAMMTKLFEAVSPQARLILLGDRDQLASVEAGCVLGDMCKHTQPYHFSAQRAALFQGIFEEIESIKTSQSALEDSVLYLQKSFRFNHQSGIGQLAAAIQGGQSKLALEHLHNPQFQDLNWISLKRPEQMTLRLKQALNSQLESYFKASSPQEALDRFLNFRVLCAVRQGPWGVQGLNYLIESLLRESKQIHIMSRREGLYHACPIMIVQNDYRLNLFNGDIGIVRTAPNGRLRAHFQMPEGHIQSFSTARLPAYEKAWAMTVHKSQGSEFKNVLMILPNESNAILTRELIYTGVTRAKSTLEIWGQAQVLEESIQKMVQRMSGLVSLLEN